MAHEPTTQQRADAPTFSAFQVASACGGHVLAGEPAATGRGVCRDTRALRPGQVFFALVGRNHDGHRFLPDAVDAGANVLVVERLPDTPVPLDCVSIVQVPDTTDALLELARWHRNRLRGRVLAITGSYGKTTTKEMVRDILAAEHSVTAAPASYNNRIGVALTLLAARRDDQFVVLEMGTNHPGEIDELAGAARPHLGAITAIDEVHLEGLGSLEGVREAKAELIPHLPPRGALVLNADNAQCMMLADRHPGPVLTFGTSKEAIVRMRNVRPLGDGWSFEALGTQFLLPVGGRYNVHNAAAALGLVRWLGVSARTARRVLAEFRLPGLRYQREYIGGVRFVMDCYNSNPAALRAAAQSFAAETTEGRRIVVCGDMLELGDRAAELHRRTGRQLAGGAIDALVAVGPLSAHVVDGWRAGDRARRPSRSCPSVDEAWQTVWDLAEPGDTVLLKGSRGMRLEKLVSRIRDYVAQNEREVA